jgi:hypothetical protein
VRTTPAGDSSASTSEVSNETASSTAAPPAGAQVLVAIQGWAAWPPDPDAAIAPSAAARPEGVRNDGGGAGARRPPWLLDCVLAIYSFHFTRICGLDLASWAILWS